MTVRELEVRMDPYEFRAWMVADTVRANPGPSKTKEERAAELMAEIAEEKVAAEKRRGRT